MKSIGLLFVGFPFLAACTFDDAPPSGDHWGTSGTGGSTTRATGITSATTGSSTTGFSTTGATSTGTGPTPGGKFDGGFGTYDKPVTVAPIPPPAVSGGTIAVIAAGHKAAVADPDRDQVTVVDLDALSVAATIQLEKRDEPGRMVEDAAGRLHVVLRGAGVLATLDPVAGTVLARRSVCAHPRGIAYDANANVLHVACAGGELVSLPPMGDATRLILLDRDLRDVVIDGERLLVSRFRTAELLVVEPDGHVSSRMKPSSLTALDGGANGFEPGVAWRTIPAPGGGAIMLHQEEAVGEIMIQPGGYGGSCGGIVKSVVSVLRVGDDARMSGSLVTTLAVDIALSGDQSRMAIAGAGVLPVSSVPTRAAAVLRVDMPSLGPVKPPKMDGGIVDAGPTRDAFGPPPGCSFLGTPEPVNDGMMRSVDGGLAPQLSSQAVAVAFDASGRLLVQTRQPALIVTEQNTSHVVNLPGDAMPDTGHELFHLGTIAGVACASCHPEGHEDGHTWTFSGLGARRTQEISGGILGTEPFHWDGDMDTFSTLAHQVFNSRMVGPSLQDEHITALANWINALPGWKPTAPADGAAAERGRVLFQDPKVGCAGCHAGAKMTNNASVNVGTGRALQVPSLRGVGFRPPYLHNGCAATLADRFGSCGGGDAHGVTSTLTAAERADLVAYLGTL